MFPVSVSLVLALALAFAAAPAMGHGADLKAYVAFESPLLGPGSHTLTLQLLDFYDNPVPAVEARADVSLRGTPNSQFATILAEEGPGRYVGRLILPGPGMIDFRIEAVLPDGRWRGAVKLATDSNATVKPVISLVLRHADMPLLKPLGAFIGALMSLIVVGSVAMFVLDAYRHPKSRG